MRMPFSEQRRSSLLSPEANLGIGSLMPCRPVSRSRRAIIGGWLSKGKAEDRGGGTMLVIARASSHSGRAQRVVELKRRVITVLDLEEQLSCAALGEDCHGGLEQSFAKA